MTEVGPGSTLRYRQLLMAAALTLAGMWALPNASARAAGYAVLYDFPRILNPVSHLLLAGPGGALFGAIPRGDADSGTIFRLAPPAPGQTRWTYSILFTFHGTPDLPGDGATPEALAFDRGGALIGTTSTGGARGLGTVFKLTPPASGQGAWMRTVLFDQFDNAAGIPRGRIYVDSTGVIYGTAQFGGSGAGAAYRLAPPSSGQGEYVLSVLHSFAHSEANYPSGLTLGQDGAFYGATDSVFRLVRPKNRTLPWIFQSLVDEGNAPIAETAPIADKALTLFGVAPSDGPAGLIYKASPPTGGQTAWNLTTLTLFNGGADGGFPRGQVAEGPDAALYGVANYGPYTSDFCRDVLSGCGFVYKLTPRGGSAPASGAYNRVTLHYFGIGLTDHGVGIDGGQPDADLVKMTLPSHDWALFGTTERGGAHGHGVIYELVP